MSRKALALLTPHSIYCVWKSAVKVVIPYQYVANTMRTSFCYVKNVLRKIERPQYLRVGASGRLVDFQSAITGKKRTQNPWMPPTHHNDMDFSDFLWESWFLT